jgi:hypothetical protein
MLHNPPVLKLRELIDDRNAFPSNIWIEQLFQRLAAKFFLLMLHLIQYLKVAVYARLRLQGSFRARRFFQQLIVDVFPMIVNPCLKMFLEEV